MWIKRDNPRDDGTATYHLMDGTDYLYHYGRSRKGPTYYKPRFERGYCSDVLNELPSGSVDLIIDDPPYGITQSDWDSEPDWDELTELYGRVLADDGQLVVFGRQPSLIPVYNAFTGDGFEFRFEAIWRKHNAPWVSNSQPIPIHENIFVFKKKSAKVGDLTFNLDAAKRDYVFVCDECGPTEPGAYTVPRGDKYKSDTQGSWEVEYTGQGDESRFPISVLLEYKSVNGTSDEYIGYPGQKPFDLMRWVLVVLSDENDVVLDPHAGSASTLAAAIPLLRKSIGVEPNPERYEKAEERLNGWIEELSGLKHASINNVDLLTP